MSKAQPPLPLYRFGTANDDKNNSTNFPTLETSTSPLVGYNKSTSNPIVPHLFETEKSEKFPTGKDLDSDVTPNNKYLYMNQESEEDFDLDREPRWAFENEGLSYFLGEKRPLKVLVVTWNLNGKKPDNVIEKLLNTKNTGHHIIAVATQECLRSIGASFFNSSKMEWVDQLKVMVISEALGNKYQMVKDHTMNALHMAVFVRKEIVSFITDVESTEVATGFGNVLGNKGAIGISFKIFDNSFLFLNCHLAAGQSSIEKRNDNILKIIDDMTLPWEIIDQEQPLANEEHALFSYFDFIFCAGDLNYRVDLAAGDVMERIGNKDFESLLNKDQLNLEKNIKKTVFQQFEEGEIRFAPTYKLEREKQEFKVEQDKGPAWTDRILYSCKNKTVKLEQRSYDSNRKVMGSDHRPVFSQFLATLDFNKDNKGFRFEGSPQVKNRFCCGF